VSPSPVERPTGRDEIRAAVLEAAARRFATDGPDASLRDIADDAGVNLGLIHRHVGNKDDLLRAVIEREIAGGPGAIEQAADAAAALRRIFEGAASDGRYVRIVAWLLLREPHAPRHQDRYPGMAALRALAADDGLDDADRDARLMVAMAAIYGWTVFGPQLRAAFATEETDRPALDRRLAEVVGDIIRREPSNEPAHPARRAPRPRS
jgi:TetR/AcrR family transcriptional regulator, repressor for neighboring sulfatase